MRNSLIFIICIFSITLNAIANNKTVKFDGIAIFDSISNFSEKLEKKGYEKTDKSDYKGDNDGLFSNSIIRIQYFERQSKIKTVRVYTAESDNWNDLAINYNYWKEYLKKQYGTPNKEIEQFDYSIPHTTSAEKIAALKKNLCFFVTTYKGKDGLIVLRLNSTDEFGCRPEITYVNMDIVHDYLESVNHLKFMNIPLNGPMDSFNRELINKKFKYKHNIDDIAVFTGEFAGYADCNLFVYPVIGHDIVYSVTVTFPQCEDWNTVYSEYTFLKKILIKKYESPFQSEDIFQTKAQLNKDQNQNRSTTTDQVQYNTMFELKNGEIILSIAKTNTGFTNYYYVQLTYIDSFNSALNPTQDIISNAMKDL